MPRRTARPAPDRTIELTTSTKACPACGGPLWAAAKARRSVTTLDGVLRLATPDPHLPQSRLPSPRHLPPARAGGALRPAAARVRPRRHRPGRPPPPRRASQRPGDPRRADPPRRCHLRAERHQPAGSLRRAAGPLAAPTPSRLQAITAAAGRVILAIDGLQPDVGHEVLWVIRDVLSGEVLLARSLLSSTQDDLAKLLGEVKDALEVPIAGVVSDGQTSIRKAVAEALRGRAPSALPLPLPPRGGPAGLRGRPPRQGPAQEEGPRHPADRAAGRGPRRCRGRGDPGLLRRGPLGVDRRRPSAAGGVGAEAARTGWRRSPRAWTGWRAKRGSRRS